MPSPVKLWFEFASTYSYPAAMRAEEQAHARGLTLQWQPMLLGPIFKAQGLEDSPFVVNPVKGAYMWRDLERICDVEGLPFRRPSRFPRGSLLATRIACRFVDAPWIGGFIRDVYTANFAHDADIDEPDVVKRLLTAQGQDARAVIEAATTPEAKAALRTQTEAAMAKGIFGAPTFDIAGELFWGHDRMRAAFDWAEAA
jgi:2-hydroxychromene-2-carboxylate isomerase